MDAPSAPPPSASQPPEGASRPPPGNNTPPQGPHSFGPRGQPDASAEPPPLTEGIIRVKVPPDRIAQFLAARSRLFETASAEVINKAASLMQGLECAGGSEIISAARVNDGLGILFSGEVHLLLAGAGGELIEFERLAPGDSFGELGALLGKPSPFIALAREAARVLWLPAPAAQGMVASTAPVAEALFKRIAEQMMALSAMKSKGELEVMTEIEGQLLQVIEAGENAYLPMPSAKPRLFETPPAPVIPFIELRDYDLSPSVLQMVPSKTVRMHRLLPVKLVDSVLTVAMVNPRDQAGLAELRRALPAVELVPVAIGLEEFASALVRLKLDDSRSPRGLGAARVAPESFSFESAEPAERETRTGDDSIRLVNKIIAAGLEREASDIHIEPAPQGFRVRFRVQGLLEEWNEQIPSNTSLKSLTARIKVLAGLEITERRLPQDGRIGLSIGRREIDLRVSTLPANRGEKIALRILEAAGSTRALDQIFFEPDMLTAARRALNRPYGGIVVAGPTGSGKTSTLYSLLNERKVTRPDNNFITVEDPIEYRLAGVTQVQVNMAAGLGFPEVLRSMLRQDPDVIVVGEMRDEKTAQIALESAMTGHLLLTSLHANNPISALARLEQLGCSRAVVAQAIQLVLVQRLVRKLCQVCRKTDPVLPALHASLVARGLIAKYEHLLPRPVGCDACGGTGYVGRAAIFECLIVSDTLREQIASGRSFADIRSFALDDGAYIPMTAYARYLLQKQIIGASEVLMSLAE